MSVTDTPAPGRRHRTGAGTVTPRVGPAGRRIAAVLLVGTALGAASAPAVHAAVGHPARPAAAAGTAERGTPPGSATRHRSGVHVSIRCPPGPAAAALRSEPGTCGIGVVVCDGDEDIVVSLLSDARGAGVTGPGELTTDVGDPCTRAPEPPPRHPPPRPHPPVPRPPVPPAPPPPAHPHPVVAAPVSAPLKHPAVRPHTPPPTRPRPPANTPTPSHTNASPTPTSTPAATIAPQPEAPRTPDAQRWWLLTMTTVLLPAVIAAAVPRIVQRTR